MKKKIAVIGAGFFGSVSAIMLSKYYKVDLFEKIVKFCVVHLGQISSDFI